jgi:formate dehydrogenase subunit gamma
MLMPEKGGSNSGFRGRNLPSASWAGICSAIFLIVAVLFPIAGSAWATELPGHSAVTSAAGPENTLGDESDSDIWRAIRHGATGTSTSYSRESGVLIQAEGEAWRVDRLKYAVDYGGKFLAGVLALILLYFVIRGRIKIKDGRSGLVMPRFALAQRIVHWSVAVLFVLLGVSGLVLLFGRTVLKPLMGADAFGVMGSAMMQGHNLFGPLFILAIIALFFLFVQGNGIRWVDFKWLLKGGGFFGGHASSHKYNFGEKTWFWWSIIFGLVLSTSGVAMLFPDIMPGRVTLQLANLFHAGAAILFIAFGIGHIYLGTVGMEGALEGMTRGTVDKNWAKAHHDLWYEEHRDTATTDTSRAEVVAAASGDALQPGAGE